MTQHEMMTVNEINEHSTLLTGLCCPRCHSALRTASGAVCCTNPTCQYGEQGFPQIGHKPVLIDFENSVFPRENYTRSGESVRNRKLRGGVAGWLRDLVLTVDMTVAPRNAERLLVLLRSRPEPRLLIIGGGAVGHGLERIIGSGAVKITAVDVYDSPDIDLLADGHSLPFPDETFDAVWIQAVLEHVLEPHTVVHEIYRVLRPNGLVYSETPFMMPVHEGAYDFTRYSRSGHRWLFHDFDQIDAGVLGGAGTTLVWSIRYFWRAFGAGDKWATALTLPFFWLRHLDRFMRARENQDAGCAFWFLGRKLGDALRPSAMPEYY